MTLLKTHFGRLDPEWGQVNRFRRGKVDVPIDGGPDIYRAVYGTQQDDGTLTAVDGDTFIMFVTWDKNGKLSVRKHPPVRLGDAGRDLAALRRSVAALCRDEDEAGLVHRGRAKGTYRSRLPSWATLGRQGNRLSAVTIVCRPGHILTPRVAKATKAAQGVFCVHSRPDPPFRACPPGRTVRRPSDLQGARQRRRADPPPGRDA